jgi:hypothetical protein
MPARIVRISKPAKTNKAQWTFKSIGGYFRWSRTAEDGTVVMESRSSFPTLAAAKQDAATRGWTPSQATVSFKVG